MFSLTLAILIIWNGVLNETTYNLEGCKNSGLLHTVTSRHLTVLPFLDVRGDCSNCIIEWGHC